MIETSFQQYLDAAESMGETNDCVPRAFAAATGLTYKEAIHECKKVGRRPRSGMFYWQIADVMFNIKKTFGIGFKEYSFYSKTTRTLLRELPKNGTFFILTSRHAITVVDGEPMDWVQDRNKLRIKNVWEVVA